MRIHGYRSAALEHPPRARFAHRYADHFDVWLVDYVLPERGEI